MMPPNQAVSSSSPTILAGRATRPLAGSLTPPGDKSVSHRALILGALARGRSTIEGLLGSKDVEATAEACRQLGAHIKISDHHCTVDGIGASGMTAPGGNLDMGNSGTAMRLLAGVLAGQSFDSILVGDDSLSARPMNRIVTPLREMGAVINARENGCAPLHIEGGHQLTGIHYRSPVASAQVKSCVLLAGLFASGETAVTEPVQSRDHTERMLRTFGATDSNEPFVQGGSALTAVDLAVPADISSAAFAMAAASLVPGSQVRLRNVGLNPTRSGLVDAMRDMGCDLRIENQRWFGAEPVGDIEIRGTSGLSAVDLGGDDIPSMIDELPILMALAARAKGVSRIRDAAELRVKESDRIAVMAEGLELLGFRVQQYPDGIDIEGQPVTRAGGEGRPVLREAAPGNVDGAGDHRCAMSFCVLAQTLDQQLKVDGCSNIDTSYPGFVTDLASLGANLLYSVNDDD